jgi:hypothetical protein
LPKIAQYYEQAYVAQTKTASEQDRAKQADAEKLKSDIAQLKAKIADAERALDAEKSKAEKARLEESARRKLVDEHSALAAKLAVLEKESQKQPEKKPEQTEARKSAAEALMKLATAREKTQAEKLAVDKLQTEKLLKEKLALLQSEKYAQDHAVKALAEKLAQENQRAKYEQTANEYRRVLGERVNSTGDAAFLQRVIKQSYGVPATALELKYFAEDKDPKKREKLVDLILTDPEVAKKLGQDAKEKLLAESARTTRVVPTVTASNAVVERVNTARVRSVDPFVKLLEQVLDGKRSDEQVADAVTLATVGRYPSEAEQKMMLASVTGASDRRAAWKKVLDTLAGTKEAQAHAETLKKK